MHLSKATVSSGFEGQWGQYTLLVRGRHGRSSGTMNDGLNGQSAEILLEVERLRVIDLGRHDACDERIENESRRSSVQSGIKVASEIYSHKSGCGDNPTTMSRSTIVFWPREKTRVLVSDITVTSCQLRPL